MKKIGNGHDAHSDSFDVSLPILEILNKLKIGPPICSLTKFSVNLKRISTSVNSLPEHSRAPLNSAMADYPSENPELIARLRDPKTCRQAFSEVIATYSEPLYWQIRRMVQDHEDANDLLQNTFMKAWKSLDAFRGDAKLSTWLYKIAVNESITHLERLKKRQNVSLDDEDSSLAALIEADTHFDGDELQKKLRLAIATLPEKQRLVFNMKYFDEMKYEDMSQILGTSVGALKASYHLAVKKIEQYFAEHD